MARDNGAEQLDQLRIKIFMDGADLSSMRDAAVNNLAIKGFTTNPTLMRKSGVMDYASFAKEAIATVGDLPISFEVFSDTFQEMAREARVIRGWGGNTYVKIPVTNTRQEPSTGLIRMLSGKGIPLNLTAILTLDQVREVVDSLDVETPSIVSVFAGRIADTGVDPIPLMKRAAEIVKMKPKAELLWASSRESLNIFQADCVGCDIITVTNDLLAKLPLVGKDLTLYSLDTVKMFHEDARHAGYKIV